MDSNERRPGPRFSTVARHDPLMERAHSAAADSMRVFEEFVRRPGAHRCFAKLCFRDPNATDPDERIYIWLSEVHFHPDEELFSGLFFEVPDALTEWHRVGERLGFIGPDTFDWMVNDEGRLHGGFTLRVTRSRLQEELLAQFDAGLGVGSWAPTPGTPAV